MRSGGHRCKKLPVDGIGCRRTSVRPTTPGAPRRITGAFTISCVLATMYLSGLMAEDERLRVRHPLVYSVA